MAQLKQIISEKIPPGTKDEDIKIEYICIDWGYYDDAYPEGMMSISYKLDVDK